MLFTDPGQARQDSRLCRPGFGYLNISGGSQFVLIDRAPGRGMVAEQNGYEPSEPREI
jgi:hypothetical protein